jgi:hypothetical protein
MTKTDVNERDSISQTFDKSFNDQIQRTNSFRYDNITIYLIRGLPTEGRVGCNAPPLLKFAFNNCENLDFIPTTPTPALSASVHPCI